MATAAFQLKLTDASARQVLADSLRMLRSGANGPLRPAFRRVAARYLGFIRTRFVRASQGDGTWKPLALSTRRRRLAKIQPGRLRGLVASTGLADRRAQIQALLTTLRFPILRDTSILFGSLTEGAPGNVIDYSSDGVRVGTRVYYGIFHQAPTIPGRPPQRLIFVDPDPATEAAIGQELALAIVSEFLDQQRVASEGFTAEGAD